MILLEVLEDYNFHTYSRGADIKALDKRHKFPRVEVVSADGISEVADFETDREALEVLSAILGDLFFDEPEPYCDGWYDLRPFKPFKPGDLSVAAFGRDEQGVYYITPSNPRLSPSPKLADAEGV